MQNARVAQRASRAAFDPGDRHSVGSRQAAQLVEGRPELREDGGKVLFRERIPARGERHAVHPLHHDVREAPVHEGAEHAGNRDRRVLGDELQGRRLSQMQGPPGLTIKCLDIGMQWPRGR